MLKCFTKKRKKLSHYLFDDYTTIASKAKYEVKHGKGPKISTTKQVFQRLPITLAQVKAGNRYEDLLNEIRQITYSLYRAKQITRKV